MSEANKLLEKVKEHLERHNIKQREIYEYFNVTQPNVSNALNGLNNTLLNSIAQYLIDKYSVDPSEFFPERYNWRKEYVAQVEEVKEQLKTVNENMDLVLSLLGKQINSSQQTAKYQSDIIKMIKDLKK